MELYVAHRLPVIAVIYILYNYFCPAAEIR